jgi:large subunit ribosomal protein L6
MSRVGVKPIALPDKVKVSVSGRTVNAEGPKGKLSFDLPKGVDVKEEEGGIVVTRASDLREHRALHGTVRSLVNNMVIGVSDGFTKELEIQGVGMRAAVKGKALDLSLDKQMVGQFAAEVRSYYPPEPYKGKGVRYAGERVRRKEGKSVGK